MTAKILIIEDEKTLLNALKKNLEKAGYEVLVAYEGEEGLKVVNESHPDLILLDIIMPKMDGVTVLQELKKNEATKDIPVIVLSNLSSGEKVVEAKKQGLTDYLIKADWQLKDILARIEQILAEAKNKQANS